MAPFHGRDYDPSTSQASSRDANSSQTHVPSLEKPISPKKRGPIHDSSQLLESRESVTTLRATRPPPPRPASRARQPATHSGGASQNQANRGRSRETSQLSLGLQLEPLQEISVPQQYRTSEVDELSDMISRMRTLTQGSVSITSQRRLNRC
jgi:hypothetical protein